MGSEAGEAAYPLHNSDALYKAFKYVNMQTYIKSGHRYGFWELHVASFVHWLFFCFCGVS